METSAQSDPEWYKNNPPFYQVNMHNSPALRTHIGENPRAVQILIYLTERMPKSNLLMCPTNLLVEEFGLSKSTINRAIQYLKQHKLVDIAKIGSNNLYGINGAIFWKDKHCDEKYRVFDDVRALAANSDNPEYLKKARLLTPTDCGPAIRNKKPKKTTAA